MLVAKLAGAGNAMTASVLSACLFGLMCWALPTANGKQLLQAPSHQNLPPASPTREMCAKTLMLGDDPSDLAADESERVEIEVSVVVESDDDDGGRQR